MDEASKLVKYFEGDLVYFKDSFAIASRLKEALKTGVDECDKYLETNIKKLD